MKKLEVFALRASGLGLMSMRLDSRKDIQSVKSTRSILHAQLKAYVLAPIKRNDKGHKMNTTGIFITKEYLIQLKFPLFGNNIRSHIQKNVRFPVAIVAIFP